MSCYMIGQLVVREPRGPHGPNTTPRPRTLGKPRSIRRGATTAGLPRAQQVRCLLAQHWAVQIPAPLVPAVVGAGGPVPGEQRPVVVDLAPALLGFGAWPPPTPLVSHFIYFLKSDFALYFVLLNYPKP